MKSGGGTCSPACAISLRSAPAQNAISPAPVRTSTLAVSSSLNRRMPSKSPDITAALRALRASGRQIVNQAISPRRSYVTGVAASLIGELRGLLDHGEHD